MTSPHAYVFQHIECEALGTFAEGLAACGVQPQYVRLFAGDRLPDDWRDAAILIFLGGPMSVNDEAASPYLRDEKTILRDAVDAGHPVLGVCLGAQLLAAAAGSRVFPGPRPEIGWEPVSLTLEGRQDPVVSGLTHIPAVFHWHGETFDLPPGATRLAFSGLTMNQAFRIGERAYGLQFHLEVDAAMIDSWVQAYPHDLDGDADTVKQRLRTQTALHAEPLRRAAREAITRFVAVT
jgi:GMP synthase-like glutamine amidotransferase